MAFKLRLRPGKVRLDDGRDVHAQGPGSLGGEMADATGIAVADARLVPEA